MASSLTVRAGTRRVKAGNGNREDEPMARIEASFAIRYRAATNPTTRPRTGPGASDAALLGVNVTGVIPRVVLIV